MSSGNRPREQKGARKTGLLEHLEATGAAGQRTMSGSLKLRPHAMHHPVQMNSGYGRCRSGPEKHGTAAPVGHRRR